jgi:transposase
MDAILYRNRTECPWRQLPHDFPPWETVYWYFKTWNDDGVTERIHDTLRAAVGCRVMLSRRYLRGLWVG